MAFWTWGIPCVWPRVVVWMGCCEPWVVGGVAEDGRGRARDDASPISQPTEGRLPFTLMHPPTAPAPLPHRRPRCCCAVALSCRCPTGAAGGPRPILPNSMFIHLAHCQTGPSTRPPQICQDATATGRAVPAQQPALDTQGPGERSGLLEDALGPAGEGGTWGSRRGWGTMIGHVALTLDVSALPGPSG